MRTSTSLSARLWCGLWLGLGWSAPLHAQQSKPTPAPIKRPAVVPGKPATAKPVTTTNVTAKPAAGKPAPTPAAKPAATTPPSQEPKPEATAEQLTEQGKAQYKAGKFPQALAKFEAALKLEPERDDALGLGAELAYRLDDQAKARVWFLRRAELPNQKDSIRAYSFYRAALSYWREAHDAIAMNGTYKDGKTVFKVPEKQVAPTEELLTSGLYYVERALNLTGKYAEAHTLKSLLHREYAFLLSDEKKLAEHQRLSLAALRRALDLTKEKDPKTVAADFGTPTVILGEFAPTKIEEDRAPEPETKLVEGGEVLKRVAAVFPAIRPPKADAAGDAPPDGVTKEGGAVSLGGGRGALTAAYAPGKVKVEVLISTSGAVVFAHVVQGRSDLNGAAVAAARKWTFKPATFEGHPVQLSGVITFDMRPGRPAGAPTPAPKP